MPRPPQTTIVGPRRLAPDEARWPRAPRSCRWAWLERPASPRCSRRTRSVILTPAMRPWDKRYALIHHPQEIDRMPSESTSRVQSRQRFLRRLGAAGAAAPLVPVVPRAVTRRGAAAQTRAASTPIQHVIIAAQEHRAFDHSYVFNPAIVASGYGVPDGWSALISTSRRISLRRFPPPPCQAHRAREGRRRFTEMPSTTTMPRRPRPRLDARQIGGDVARPRRHDTERETEQ